MNKNLTTAADAADMEVASLIVEAIDSKSTSQESIAQEIGVSYTTLRRGLEQHRGDKRSFSIRELARIADALGTTPAALLPDSLKRADA